MADEALLFPHLSKKLIWKLFHTFKNIFFVFTHQEKNAYHIDL